MDERGRRWVGGCCEEGGFVMSWVCVDEDGIFYGFRGESEVRLRISVPGPSDADRDLMIGLQFANAADHRHP